MALAVSAYFSANKWWEKKENPLFLGGSQRNVTAMVEMGGITFLFSYSIF